MAWSLARFSDGNNSASTVSTAQAHSGSSSLHLVASAGGTTKNSSIWQTTAALSGTYTLSYWYLENTNGGTLTLRNRPDGGLEARLSLPRGDLARLSTGSVDKSVGSMGRDRASP